MHKIFFIKLKSCIILLNILKLNNEFHINFLETTSNRFLMIVF